MTYAVIVSGGKQYQVRQGSIIEIPHTGKNPNDVILFDKVLLLVDGERVAVGKPFLPGMSVYGKMLLRVTGEKVRVSKYKAKARYRRVTGHRQLVSKVKIEKIDTEVKPAAEKSTRRRTKIAS